MIIMMLFVILFTIPSVSTADDVLYQCQTSTGEIIYTNKDQKYHSCKQIQTPKLSIVPQRKETIKQKESTEPYIPSSFNDGLNQEPDMPLIMDSKGSFTFDPRLGHKVNEQVCDLYGKWLDLNLATRGGLYYSPMTAPLITLFGGGFIPMECRVAGN